MLPIGYDMIWPAIASVSFQDFVTDLATNDHNSFGWLDLEATYDTVELVNSKSTVVQVLACFRQATTHHLKQYWPMLRRITKPATMSW